VVIIRGVDSARIRTLDKSALDNLIFNIGLAEIPSYWKATCSPKIVIKAGYLDNNQIAFWRDLIANMGQFFYENDLPFISPEFTVTVSKKENFPYSTRNLRIVFWYRLGEARTRWLPLSY